MPQLGLFVAILHAKPHDLLRSGSHSLFKCRSLIISGFWRLTVLQHMTAPTWNDLLTCRCQSKIKIRSALALNSLIMHLINGTGLYEARIHMSVFEALDQ